MAIGHITLDALAVNRPTIHDGRVAWFQTGIALVELALLSARYVVRGKLARILADPQNDAAAAVVEELAYLHNTAHHADTGTPAHRPAL